MWVAGWLAAGTLYNEVPESSSNYFLFQNYEE